MSRGGKSGKTFAPKRHIISSFGGLFESTYTSIRTRVHYQGMLDVGDIKLAYINTDKHIHTYMHTCIHTKIQTCMHTNTHSHTLTYIHTYIFSKTMVTTSSTDAVKVGEIKLVYVDN